MLVIVTYDVSTETREGRRRLRRVAKLCEGVGQRVQKSVFECQVDLLRFEELERRLLEEINKEEDNLRIYRITEPTRLHVREYGCFRALDFEGPLLA
ncbi:MAG: CRISPR-associated endonuclease Cas2 [Hydrogenophilales bacterium CG_4_9_14_3_um_filter_59_35]|nr:MAG: CRISPR-associated endonuclease Cas2 [Hydrogenophilales bacterium CG18_big_fil_WC_8_21_14_2_50_58_12]PIX98614.1 MAG: CRISPR-associated endonuclease Cas2 [Hydrogenophilales bacterium CG_4_10_14_3_um_filter_58_23]PJB04981.1 MAG: CRISPR-associated endonuclease Cas2 [Hydrogenophilales bacterium CG_4_9_14_3_um_filter_59_35]